MNTPCAPQHSPQQQRVATAAQLTADDLRRMVRIMGAQAAEDIQWAERVRLPRDAQAFASETIFVIANSGMHNTAARRIFERVMAARHAGQSASSVFGHTGKAAAMDRIWGERDALYAQLLQRVESTHNQAARDEALLAFCESLPWIGGITKYHLGKNFGAQVAKPDRHLVRLAEREGCTPQQLCERLAAATGWRVTTVDTLLWRARRGHQFAHRRDQGRLNRHERVRTPGRTLASGGHHSADGHRTGEG